ncbi:MAG: helix-turn-helix transcriptional regulator [Brevundimonas sp.]
MTKRADLTHATASADISRTLEQVRETGALAEALEQIRAVQLPSLPSMTLEARAASQAMRDAYAASLPSLEAVRAMDLTARALTDAARTAQAVQLPALDALTAASRHLDDLRAGQIAADAALRTLPSPYPFEGSAPARAAPPQRPVASVEDLGPLVRARRRALGLTQQDLADAAGTGRRFISELEAGKATVEFGKVLQVCRSLGLDLFVAQR